MPPLPIISGADCIRALRLVGYQAARQRGSHVHLTHPTRISVTVPMHTELDRGTLRSILRSADLSVDQLVALL